MKRHTYTTKGHKATCSKHMYEIEIVMFSEFLDMSTHCFFQYSTSAHQHMTDIVVMIAAITMAVPERK